MGYGLNEEQKRKLLDLAERRGWDQGEMGKALGCSGALVSKLLNGKYEAPVTEWEAKVQDLLETDARQRETAHDLFDTPVTRAVAGAMETIQETNDFGLVSSEAGLGKSCGARLYHQAHKLSLLVTAAEWNGGRHGLEAAVWEHVDSRAWKFSCTRGEWLARRLKGSGRLLMVDNAHKLSPSALAWLFDMHDVTGCPVALLGNPEVLDKIRGNDQFNSRIGLHRQLGVKPAAWPGLVRQLAEHVIATDGPTADDEALDLLTQIASKKGQGHLRSVRKTILQARKIRENAKAPKEPGDPDLRTWAGAIRAAHTQLVRNYDLN